MSEASTLTRPPERYIRAFRPSMIGDDTVGVLLDRGWSLGICCRDCPRVVEWTPAALSQRFGAQPDLKLVDRLPRLSCARPLGCGSKHVVIFPY